MKIYYWIFSVFFILFSSSFLLANNNPKITIRDFDKAMNLKIDSTPVLVCSPDGGFKPSGNIMENSKFFGGKKRMGILIVGIDAAKIYTWVNTLKTDDLNQKIKEMVSISSLYTIQQSSDNGKLKAEKHSLFSSEVQIPQTYASCLEEGPKSFQCGQSNKDNLIGCCEGTSKFFGFRAQWKSDKSPMISWNIRYGHGNGSPLVAKGPNQKDEPLRFCQGALLVK